MYQLIFLLFALFLNEIGSVEVPVVRTNTGLVSGISRQSFQGEDYLAYLGIPFAEPPTGDLRFKPPIAKEPWSGVHNGSIEGSPCLQMLQFNEPQVFGSEDCLWLNVYTPPNVSKTSLKPVLVWIYGGRFLIGTASSMVYSPDFLMDHDIIVVSIQYRVGPYGFLSTGDSSAPGNYGFHDQVLALKWIQENIQQFGGDPKSVTISGHSAGSASIHLHMLSPKSKGLFSKSISLSGTAANFWAGRSTYHSHYAKELAEKLSCPSEEGSEKLINCLKQIDPIELTQAQWKTHDFFHKSPAKLPLSTFIPRIDKEAEDPFMPENPLELLRRGNIQNLPWMVGLTSQEGAWYTSSLFGQDSMEYLKEYDTKPIEATKSFMSGTLTKKEDIEKVLNFYSKGEPIADQNQRVAFTELASDMIFNAEALLAVHLQSRKNSAPVFFYQFNHRGSWTFAQEFEETKHDYDGVAHLDDISYFMRVRYHPDLTEEEVQVMKSFTGFIVEFVKYGQPTGGNPEGKYDQDWQKFEPGNGVSMLIENPPRISRELPFQSKERPGRIKFWMDILGHPEDILSDYLNPKDEL